MGPETVAVWSASVERGAPPSADLSLLSVEERARAARFRFARDRELYVLGKRMTRSLLGRRLGLCPRSLVFDTAARGKPQLAGGAARSGLRFNLAHSGAYVFVGLTRQRRIGVDVEHERPGLDLLGLARRFFCAEEFERLAAGPPAETRRLFYKYWTLKEAYLKAEGSGLAIDLTAVDASHVPDEYLAPPVSPAEDAPRGIRVQRLPAPPGYAAAVACDAETWTVQLREWQADAFAEGAGIDGRAGTTERPRPE
jgi:4'-phosphopantetheinyl transferase